MVLASGATRVASVLSLSPGAVASQLYVQHMRQHNLAVTPETVETRAAKGRSASRPASNNVTGLHE